MRYEIDLAAAVDRAALHSLLKKELSFPDWYGGNLDALHDLLSEGTVKGELVFRNASVAPPSMQGYIARLRKVCEDVPPELAVIWEDEAENDPHIDRVRELRAITERHYNCAQSVLLPFAEDLGLDEELLYRFAANFGGGMKRESVCGAVTGALMVLGLFGVDDPETIEEYHDAVRGTHDGHLDCADLLEDYLKRHEDRKEHCDAIICESILLVEKILRKKGKL